MPRGWLFHPLSRLAARPLLQDTAITTATRCLPHPYAERHSRRRIRGSIEAQRRNSLLLALSAGGSRIRTFRPSPNQCLSELVEPCAETNGGARREFLRGRT